MLRMPEFQVHLARSAAEAVSLRISLDGSMYVAGGTDLLPNLKHQLHAPAHLVSLEHAGLAGIALDLDGTLRIGAGTTLHAVATDPTVARELPGLARAASLVAGPQHRRMGTLGGNVMLDTRCLFYNQSLHWRQSLGYCLKAGGTWCHVIGSAKACVAAQSSDTVPVLVAADARIEALLPDGATRVVPLRTLWTKDGRFEENRTLPGEALVTAIVVPPRTPGHRSTYRKVRTRGAIDFPQLGVALVGDFQDERCVALEVVVGATMPFPKRIDRLEPLLGGVLDDATIERIADHVFRQVKPQPQLHGDVAWRRHLARVETRRGLEALRQG